MKWFRNLFNRSEPKQPVPNPKVVQGIIDTLGMENRAMYYHELLDANEDFDIIEFQTALNYLIGIQIVEEISNSSYQLATLFCGRS